MLDGLRSLSDGRELPLAQCLVDEAQMARVVIREVESVGCAEWMIERDVDVPLSKIRRDDPAVSAYGGLDNVHRLAGLLGELVHSDSSCSNGCLGLIAVSTSEEALAWAS